MNKNALKRHSHHIAIKARKIILSRDVNNTLFMLNMIRRRSICLSIKITLSYTFPFGKIPCNACFSVYFICLMFEKGSKYT